MFALRAGMAKIKLSFNRLGAVMSSNGRAAGLAMSFDDAYVDEWYRLRDVFNRFGARATFFVSNFDLLPEQAVEKLRALRDDGHEIAFHGLRHLSAGRFIAGNSLGKYLETEILPGIDAMARRGFPPVTFSYPYGVRAPRIDAALLKYFKHVRGVVCTGEKKRLVDFRQIYCGHAGGLLYAAGIDNIYANGLEEIHMAIDKAMENKKTLLLFAHRTTDGTGDYCTPPARMESVLEHAAAAGLKFYRIRDL
ncbi:MAG: polysaccharide deacetylase family protein [Nitrospiraceae bacterium]|nr:polysaccharide deacetylase family protein [Nitrospiraceae bacterium]